MSMLDDSLRFCQMFEGELLVELMLRYWKHPRENDIDFRNGLLEQTAKVIQASGRGEQLLEDVPPTQMNFIAAVWYAEWASLQSRPLEITDNELSQREEWLLTVKKLVPSCFCDPDDLMA